MRYVLPAIWLLLSLMRALAAPASDVEEARSAHWKEYMHGDDAAHRVAAKADPAVALEVLRGLAAQKEPRVHTLGVALLFEQAARLNLGDDERTALRRQLMQVAEERAASPYARNEAFRVLAASEWDGSVQWWLQRFEDATLTSPSEAHTGYRPLAYPLHRDRDAWTPRLIALLGSSRIARTNAAYVLGGDAEEHPRRDVALALLPWLSDEAWVEVSQWTPNERWFFIGSLKSVDVPEAVPGLLHIIETEKEYVIQWAAHSLNRYKDPRIVPALRTRLERHFVDHPERAALIEGIYRGHRIRQRPMLGRRERRPRLRHRQRQSGPHETEQGPQSQQ